MTTINLGKIKPLYKGTYTGGVTYRPLDFTLYSGNLYVCKASSTGNLPTDPAYFDPVVSVNAASIPNTPSGSLSSTTVQAALNELDSEKVATTAVIAIANGGTGATTANAAADAIGAFRRGTLLGTVSQSAGVPTGAVVERGANANGEYVRFADGTQICTRVGSQVVFENPSNLRYFWTYPAAFSNAPCVSMQAMSPTILTNKNLVINAYSADTAQASCALLSVGQFVADDVTGTTVSPTAVGRWF
jgi:hypothetical protein